MPKNSFNEPVKAKGGQTVYTLACCYLATGVPVPFVAERVDAYLPFNELVEAKGD